MFQTGTGRRVIIVSNNSSYAILKYLAIHRIAPVAGVVGRDESDPELMKPSPYLVRGAVNILDAHPAECAFVGDDFPDMALLRLVGLPVAVGNAVPEVRAVCAHQLTRYGGQGAVREFVEDFLKARGEWDVAWNRYVDARSRSKHEVTA